SGNVRRGWWGFGAMSFNGIRATVRSGARDMACRFKGAPPLLGFAAGRACAALAPAMGTYSLYSPAGKISNENKLHASSNHYAKFAEIRGIVTWILQEPFLLLSFQCP